MRSIRELLQEPTFDNHKPHSVVSSDPLAANTVPVNGQISGVGSSTDSVDCARSRV
jgi:hypothetical protein